VSFADSYLGQLRALVGNRPLLQIGVRVLVEDDAGRVLILRRSDTGDWGLPAGSMELNESLMDTIHREVHEEANVTVADVQVFGISSDPVIERYTYPNGDQVQSVVVLARARLAGGVLGSNDGEATDFRFVDPDTVPPEGFAPPEHPTFDHFRRHRETGAFQFV
jgi:8-oxo-dGTP pyrophosphatase MutT (NUDIX family)